MELNNPSIEALPFDFFDDQSQYQFGTFPMGASVSPLQRLRHHRQEAVPNQFAESEVLLLRGQLTNHLRVAPSCDEIAFKEQRWMWANYSSDRLAQRAAIVVIPLSHIICALFFWPFLNSPHDYLENVIGLRPLGGCYP